MITMRTQTATAGLGSDGDRQACCRIVDGGSKLLHCDDRSAERASDRLYSSLRHAPDVGANRAAHGEDVGRARRSPSASSSASKVQPPEVGTANRHFACLLRSRVATRQTMTCSPVWTSKISNASTHAPGTGSTSGTNSNVPFSRAVIPSLMERLNASTKALTSSSSALSNAPGALTTPPWCITVYLRPVTTDASAALNYASHFSSECLLNRLIPRARPRGLWGPLRSSSWGSKAVGGVDALLTVQNRVRVVARLRVGVRHSCETDRGRSVDSLSPHVIDLDQQCWRS